MDGRTGDPGSVDGRLIDVFAFELGVAVIGVALEEVISPSTEHL